MLDVIAEIPCPVIRRHARSGRHAEFGGSPVHDGDVRIGFTEIQQREELPVLGIDPFVRVRVPLLYVYVAIDDIVNACDSTIVVESHLDSKSVTRICKSGLERGSRSMNPYSGMYGDGLHAMRIAGGQSVVLEVVAEQEGHGDHKAERRGAGAFEGPALEIAGRSRYRASVGAVEG